ncbi:hypothetical protein BD414DRAFT_179844 [Trametes punicea]|nr:hypothetical protein BD414DRAFT_179844 [Trametes punicea]
MGRIQYCKACREGIGQNIPRKGHRCPFKGQSISMSIVEVTPAHSASSPVTAIPSDFNVSALEPSTPATSHEVPYISTSMQLDHTEGIPAHAIPSIHQSKSLFPSYNIANLAPDTVPDAMISPTNTLFLPLTPSNTAEGVMHTPDIFDNLLSLSPRHSLSPAASDYVTDAAVPFLDSSEASTMSGAALSVSMIEDELRQIGIDLNEMRDSAFCHLWKVPACCRWPL